MEYKKGSENKVANALSRSPDLPPQADLQKISCLFLLSVPDSTRLNIVKDSYSQDQGLQQLIQSIQVSPAPKGFTWQNGLIFYKGGFFLGLNCPLKSQVLHLVHSSLVAGHSDFLKSFQMAKKEFFLAWYEG